MHTDRAYVNCRVATAHALHTEHNHTHIACHLLFLPLILCFNLLEARKNSKLKLKEKKRGSTPSYYEYSTASLHSYLPIPN